ncbi:unnamed protein product [Rotaria sordida]|uniref:Uncharacterized protein n=1 Tax=Rotaria sordida TaxID=392033 RepID=A0A814V5M6_9BILA|nr:unnamed protein product [Rotaria sordida]CAF1446221.1 unnamed protein product [Rotaria sordida]
MNDLEIVYKLRKRINNLENKLKSLTYENVNGNPDMNRRTIARINKIEARIIKLKGIHNDKIYQVYSGSINRPKTVSIISEIEMKIIEIDIGDNITTLKMIPMSFKLDDKKRALKDIIYPTDGTDRNLINILARYRTIINKSKDFRREPFQVRTNSTETLIILLDAFVRQYEGELSFTNEDICFSDSTRYIASGIANLGSLHLLAANYILTAKFSIKINLNYDRELTRSSSIMKNFILDLNKSIANVLHCKNDFIRIFSIEKIDNKHGMIQVNFGLTTPDKNQTESLARHFQNLVRRTDFRNDKILRSIQSDRYQYELIPILSYLQLSSKDFDINSNYDYTQTDLSKQVQCGNYPYYLPIGWFRHAINLNNKYSDNLFWLTTRNINDEWPIAFHGTHSPTLTNITQSTPLFNSIKTDSMNNEDIHRITKVDSGSAIYVITHCNDGADAYTTPFTILNGDNNETFKLVFQCRVRPNSFTIYNGPNDLGQLWQITDPQAIRPYGLLLKRETILF